jgi:hypothetical protein
MRMSDLNREDALDPCFQHLRRGFQEERVFGWGVLEHNLQHRCLATSAQRQHVNIELSCSLVNCWTSASPLRGLL